MAKFLNKRTRTGHNDKDVQFSNLVIFLFYFYLTKQGANTRGQGGTKNNNGIKETFSEVGYNKIGFLKKLTKGLCWG